MASADFKNGAERLKKLNQDSAKALARPEVEAPMRMGNDATEAGEAPSDRIDASTTGGGGTVIAGTSVIAVVHPKVPEPIRTQGQRDADKGKRAGRTCHWCSQASFPRLTQETCPGRNNRKNCLYFDENGQSSLI